VPQGQRHTLWFSVLAFAGMIILTKVGRWYRERLAMANRGPTRPATAKT